MKRQERAEKLSTGQELGHRKLVFPANQLIDFKGKKTTFGFFGLKTTHLEVYCTR